MATNAEHLFARQEERTDCAPRDLVLGNDEQSNVSYHRTRDFAIRFLFSNDHSGSLFIQ